MAFVRSIVIACAVAGCAAFSPAVGAFGRVESLRKSVSYTPAATTRATPKASSRRAAASSINMGYNVDLTGKVTAAPALPARVWPLHCTLCPSHVD